MIQGILEAGRECLGISINKLRGLPEVTERYSEAELVVSALCSVGQFFGFVVAVPRTKANPLSSTPFVWSPAPATLRSSHIKACFIRTTEGHFSTSKLNTSRCLHLSPIEVMVFHLV